MIKNQFIRYVIPSMIAFAFSGVYAIVDGFFVGRNVGDVGLAAINIAYPIQAIIQATGAGLGMSGAIGMALSKGKKEKKPEQTYLGNTLILLLLFSILLTIIIAFVYKPMLILFGATGEMLSLAKDYMKVIVIGTSFQLLSTGLIPIIRNTGSAMAGMLSMFVGFILNVALDWLFVSVYQWGTTGAALATIIGQGATCIVSLYYLFVKVKIHKTAIFGLSLKYIKKILVTSCSPFGLTITPNLVIIILNKGASVYGGEEAVSTYAVISYIICVIQLLIQGIGDGVQPLIGRYYGAKELSTVRALRKMSFITAYGLTLVFMAIVYLFLEEIPSIFGVSENTLNMYIKVLPYFMAGLLFSTFLRIVTSYFYATGENRSAYIIIYGEAIILALLIGIVLPSTLGIQGVWLSVPITQIFLAFLGNIIYNKKILQQIHRVICL